MSAKEIEEFVYEKTKYTRKRLEAFSCFSMDIGQRLLEIGELLLPASGTTASLKPWAAATLSRSIRAVWLLQELC
ncbi:hypothetical protein T10_12891 [Trichinella papuae]|uniref:Uncharacterized protein n=1 Tax=Trichinella papuae TaxID=268474 RepID=A0A0V1N6J2_9BILA|nr:hypothetical protein T10_12891 [Trichinella papuae]